MILAQRSGYYDYPYYGGWSAGEIVALTIPLAIGGVLLITALLWFIHLRRRMTHEQQMLALQRGVAVPSAALPPPRVATGRTRGLGLALIGTLVPLGCLGAALGLTAMVFEYGNKWSYGSDSTVYEMRQLRERIEQEFDAARRSSGARGMDLAFLERSLNEFKNLAERSRSRGDEEVSLILILAVWAGAGLISLITVVMAIRSIRAERLAIAAAAVAVPAGPVDRSSQDLARDINLDINKAGQA
jgi:hypothetical protein